MSRHVPIYITDSEEEPMEDSEEEPMEDSYHSHASSGVSYHPRATSDDTYVPPPIRPDVTPAVVTPPTTRSQFHTGETSTRPPMRRTARMCVRDFPTGLLAPRDKAPVTDEREIPCVEPPRRTATYAHLEWMTPMLGRWRSLEGLPSSFETGESSRSPASLPTTGEPIELTLPTLVSVIRTLFRVSGSRGTHLAEIQSDITRLEGEMIEMHERCHLFLGNAVAARDTAESARTRVRVLERRIRMVGLAVGAIVIAAVLRTAVGLFWPYFH